MKLDQKGFSLVEVMFAVALSTMIGYVIFMAARTGDQQMDSREGRMTLQDNAREGLHKMIQELRQSAPSKTSIAGGAMTGSTIQFQVPDSSNLVNADYSLNWTAAKTIRYSLLNNQLLRTNVATNTTAVLANNVTAITFTGDTAAPNKVTIALSVQKTLTNGRTTPTLTLTGQAEIRNP